MDKDLTPLGELLEAARTSRRPRLSQNALAKAAGTSSTTYRRVISGVSRFGGQDIPFGGSADTVARIAQVLEVTAEQLAGVGRDDAAEELRALEDALAPSSPSGRRRGVMDDAEAVMDENERMIAEITESVRKFDATTNRTIADLIRMLKRSAEERSRNGQ